MKGDSLIAHFPEHKLWLKHFHYDVFEDYEIKNGKTDSLQKWVNQFNFISNPQGEIDQVEVKLEYTVSPVSFKRKSLSDSFQEYVGSYSRNGIEVFQVYMKDETTLCYKAMQGNEQVLSFIKQISLEWEPVKIIILNL